MLTLYTVYNTGPGQDVVMLILYTVYNTGTGQDVVVMLTLCRTDNTLLLCVVVCCIPSVCCLPPVVSPAVSFIVCQTMSGVEVPYSSLV